MAGEWETVELGEVAAVRSGYAFKSSDWTDSGIPVVKIANVKGGRLEMSGCSYVEKSTASEASEFQLKTGDILIAMTGYIGDVARVRKTDLPCVLNQRVGKFSVRDTQRLDADFLYTFLAWAETRLTIEGLGYGSAQPNVSPSLIHKVEMPLPPLAEQKAIAAVLGALDDKIELNRRMNATLEAMARALFQSWFIDFDPVRKNMDRNQPSPAASRHPLPVGEGRGEGAFSMDFDPVRAKLDSRPPAALDPATAALFPDSFNETPAEHIPDGWHVGSIYEIANIIYGAPFASSLFNSEKLGKPLIRIRDLPNESPAVFTTEVHPKGYLLQPGDIAVGMDGEFRAYLWAGVESWLNQRVCVFAPKPGYSAAFVRNTIIAPLAEVEATETATTVIHLGKNDIDRFTVIIPDAPVAEAFKRQCQPWYDQIVANKQQSRTLATLRDTLLPKLLSGELSVNEQEAALP
jgi:type I restriction enzyme S subunit